MAAKLHASTNMLLHLTLSLLSLPVIQGFDVSAPCVGLGHSIKAFVAPDIYNYGFEPHLLGQVEEMIGYSLHTRQAREMLSCNITDSHSLEELSENTNLDYFYLYHYYTGVENLIGFLVEGADSYTDMYEFAQQYVSLVQELSDWADQHQFPNMPMRDVSQAEVAAFLWHVRDTYSEPVRTRLFSPALPLIMPPEQLASILTDCQSRMDLAEALGVDIYNINSYDWNNRGSRKHGMAPFSLLDAMFQAGVMPFPQPAEAAIAEGPASCSEVYAMFLETLDIEREFLLLAMPRFEAEKHLGLNLLNLTQLNALACQFSVVQSVGDLAEVVQVPAQALQEGLHMIEMYLNMAGGHQVIAEAMSYGLELQEFLNTTGFPFDLPVPAYVTRDYVLAFLEKSVQLVNRLPMSSDMMLAIFSEYINEPEQLADIIMSAGSYEDLLAKLGPYHWFDRFTHAYIDIVVMSAPVSLRVLDWAEARGLIDIN